MSFSMIKKSLLEGTGEKALFAMRVAYSTSGKSDAVQTVWPVSTFAAHHGQKNTFPAAVSQSCSDFPLVGSRESRLIPGVLYIIIHQANELFIHSPCP